MKTFDYTIKDSAGIHARPAAQFVKTMQTFESKADLTHNGKTANCKKLFPLMGLAVKCGETVTVTADGPDEDAAAAAAQAFLQENL